MHLRDLLPPVRRTFPALLPKGPWTLTFDPNHGTAEQFLTDLHGRGLAAPNLLEAAKELYVWRFPWLRGLSNGFARASDIHGGNGRFGMWALAVLGAQGWAILEELGVNPISVLAELLSIAPPAQWREHGGLLRLPPEVLSMLRDDRLEITGPRAVSLSWLPRRMRCGLVVRGRITVSRFPEELNTYGPVYLHDVGGISTIQHLHAEGDHVHLQDLPDLQRVEVTVGTSYRIESCPQLEVVTGTLDRGLFLSDLPALSKLAILAPDLAGRAPDLTIERCSSLQRIEWPLGAWRWVRNLRVVDCLRLESLPPSLRIVGERLVEGCPLIREGH